MAYLGIDLQRKRSQVAARDEKGELLFNRRVATRAGKLFDAIGDAGEEEVQVVFEATFGWGWQTCSPKPASRPTLRTPGDQHCPTDQDRMLATRIVF